MHVTMYAYDPTGHAHLIPGMDIPTMNALLDRFQDMSDNVVNVYDVTDPDGTARRVVAVLWRGVLFDLFTYPRP